MENDKFVNLSDNKLLKHAKLLNNTRIYDAIIMGLLMGISIYSAISNGFGLLIFLPLIYLPIANKNNKKREQLKVIINKRDLD